MKPHNYIGGDQGQPATPSTPPSNTQQDAAANVIRSQIDGLYEKDDTSAAAEHPHHHEPDQDEWKAYHSAWQNYYQQYYAQYYAQQGKSEQPTSSNQYFTQTKPEPTVEDSQSTTKNEALAELRSQLLGKVEDSTKKIRKSRHFMPAVAALVVVLVFVFLQYNRVFIANVHAYVSPGAISPQNIIIDPAADTTVPDDPLLIIPKINVDVPVEYDVGTDYDSQMESMENGLAHFPIPGANAHPGELGNTVLSGHSSNDLFDPGDYKFVFAQLTELEEGDTIYANYEGTRYTYIVSKTEVVLPTQVDKLVYDTDVPVLTLITCTPLGTADKRLLVTAEQVSPDPAAATATPATSTDEEVTIPGYSPTIFERLFGWLF